MIVSLKRFSTGRSRYGGMGGGQKLQTLVDFPLDGLNLGQSVLSKGQQGEDLIYDCFAVSNHYGSMGFGHYTAYGKSPIDGQWHYYDDSSVSVVGGLNGRKNEIVSEAAYNLFYRRRGYVDLRKLDYDMLKLNPDMNYLNQKEE